MKDLVIVKLGGSVISDKSKSRGVFRKKIVERLAGEIKRAKKIRDFDLIIVHGAGSFGHPLAKKYNLHKGYSGPRSSEGLVLTKKAMFELTMLIWGSLSKVGLGSCVVEPSAVIVADGGRIKTFNTEFIENLLDKKIIPVLFGDAVFDEKIGVSIVSGDLMVSHLARKFKAEKIIFVSDVDGVYDKNPKVNKDARIIGVINNMNYKQVAKKMEVYNKNDVSGEMKGKLLTIKKDLGGFEVTIINGFSKNVLFKTFMGQNTGTTVRFDR